MFLGTARRWWIAMGVLVVLGIGLTMSEFGGALGNIVGILLLMSGIGLFAAAPMRYGDSARRSRRGSSQPTAAAPAPTPAAKPAPAARPVAPPYQPAQKIEAGDPSEVTAWRAAPDQSAPARRARPIEPPVRRAPTTDAGYSYPYPAKRTPSSPDCHRTSPVPTLPTRQFVHPSQRGPIAARTEVRRP